MSSLYRLTIARDRANPRGYRVCKCHAGTAPGVAFAWGGGYIFMSSPTPRRPGTVCNPRAILAEYQAARRMPADRRRRLAARAGFTAAVRHAEQEYFVAKAHYEARIAGAQRRYLAAVTAAKLTYGKQS